MKHRRVLGVMLAILLAVTLLISCAPASTPGPAEYPTKDIRFICPWGVGGGSDAITRKLAHLTEKYLPVSVYVENLEGGTSGLGNMAVMTARPEGYDVSGMTYDSVVTVPRKELIPGYDLKKLKMVALVTQEGDAAIVRKDSPFLTLEGFREAALASPGEIKIGNTGLGTGYHIGGLMVQEALGVQLNHIPYPGGSGPMKEGLLSGEIDVMLMSLGDCAALLDAGEIVALAELADEQNQGFPDVPTFSSLGYDLVRGSFQIMAVTAGTPDENVRILEEAMYKAHSSDEFQDWAASIGIGGMWLGVDDVTEWAMQAQQDAYAFLDELKAAGIIDY
ncbi:MAG: tripartite tricarboxylate transporter substrate binding protein [Desulfobacteraceae bacterium]|nr:tripartite tricarboxylate transporter substrate binding protein [Desulfobacteraceae bacterium]